MKKPELEGLRLFQLKRLASRIGVIGRSIMSKAALVKALVGKEPPPSKKRIRSHRKVAAPVPAQPKSKPGPKPSAVRPTATVAAPVAARTAPARPAPPPAPAPAPRPARRTAQAPAFHDVVELPRYYGVDRLVLLPRDPNWLFAYWELTPGRVEWGLGALGVSARDVKPVLRVHDVTDLAHGVEGGVDLAASRNYVAFEVAPMAEDWYIQVAHPEHAYCVEYLLQAADGRTITLVTSNVAATPSDRVSGAADEEWVTGFPRPRRVSRARGPAQSRWVIGRRPGTPTSPGAAGLGARIGSGSVR